MPTLAAVGISDENRVGEIEEFRRPRSSGVLAMGTLACPRCDAPVALAGATVSPADEIGCPFCLHHARVRDFLSLEAPTRPARVVVRLVTRARLPYRQQQRERVLDTHQDDLSR